MRRRAGFTVSPLCFESDLAVAGGGSCCGTAHEGRGQLGWDRLSWTREERLRAAEAPDL